jgi:hypothetical protein
MDFQISKNSKDLDVELQVFVFILLVLPNQMQCSVTFYGHSIGINT